MYSCAPNVELNVNCLKTLFRANFSGSSITINGGEMEILHNFRSLLIIISYNKNRETTGQEKKKATVKVKLKSRKIVIMALSSRTKYEGFVPEHDFYTTLNVTGRLAESWSQGMTDQHNNSRRVNTLLVEKSTSLHEQYFKILDEILDQALN
uniref:Uncharacterized protein n=1 Tax=Glossina austeni TaxID=7395 RepID=A0A1A9V7M2_GLOAU